jgi:hypothetical protein
MTNNYITAALTIVFLIIFGAIFMFFYFRSIKSEIEEYWAVVLQKLRLRLDKIPGLIETVRNLQGIDMPKINALIKMRSAGWPMKDSGKQKIVSELNITREIHWIWELEGKYPELKKDTNYLALKIEFKELGAEIEKMLEGYNAKVRHYNKLRGFFLLWPFMVILKYGKIPVFEFET